MFQKLESNEYLTYLKKVVECSVTEHHDIDCHDRQIFTHGEHFRQQEGAGNSQGAGKIMIMNKQPYLSPGPLICVVAHRLGYFEHNYLHSNFGDRILIEILRIV